ncbi:MAG: hypothetical protein ACK5W9_04920 [Bdellovibrionales bacterium]
MTTTKASNKRKFIRFKPDPDAVALLDLKSGSQFSPMLHALIFEESHGGVGLLVISEERLKLGQKMKVQVGRLAPLKAEVRWCEKIDKKIFKIGLMYLE